MVSGASVASSELRRFPSGCNRAIRVLLFLASYELAFIAQMSACGQDQIVAIKSEISLAATSQSTTYTILVLASDHTAASSPLHEPFSGSATPLAILEEYP